MFDWKPDYSVQIPGIDAQHQQLFALAREVHSAMAKGKGKDVLEQAFGRLVSYTKEHFADEERFMQKHQYPDLAAHKKEHDQLTAQVLAFQKRFQQHEASLTIDLMTFLKEWLEHHISGSDQKYSTFIRRKTAA